LIALERARVESEKATAQKADSLEPKARTVTASKEHREGNRPDVLNVLIASPGDVNEEWLALEAKALELRRAAEEQERRVQMFRAFRARKEAELWGAKLGRARVLAETYKAGPPRLLSDDESLAEDVAGALSLWQNRPELRVLTGPSSATIRAEIQASLQYHSVIRCHRPG
jgi:hypothetical protein